MASADVPERDDLLRPPQSEPEPLQRLDAEHTITTTFTLKERTYQQQFSDTYFLRLTILKPAVEEAAKRLWTTADEEVKNVHKVLDVRQGELCWVTGTVYMDMPLKPNVLEDISKDHWIAAPPSREKFVDPANDQIMLEDESGRIRLTGPSIISKKLVTGCIISVMGSETVDGDFEVIDVLFPGLPPQISEPPQKKRKGSEGRKYVAIVSGLNISGKVHESFETHLLVEYLLGELTGSQDQKFASSITRLILAGNSLSNSTPLTNPHEDNSATKRSKSKKYGYDSSNYNPLPTTTLDSLLCSLLHSLPIDLMPGDTDPANVSLPQQPIHPTMFPQSKAYFGSTFNPVTNPYDCTIDGVNFLGTSGQTIDDIYKYVEGDDRLGMMEWTLRWRHIAPTCPDTLWSYPFQSTDPFILKNCPHVYFVGNQPRFETKLLEGSSGQRCRIIAVPGFSKTGELVLVDLETLGCEVMRIGVEGPITE